VQAFSFLKNNQLVFPSLSEIISVFLSLLTKKHTYCLIFTTLLHLFTAVFCAFFAGILIGTLEGRFKSVYKVLFPLMTLLRSLPVIVLAVILMVLFDYAFVPFLAAVIVLVPLVSEAVYEGFCSLDKELIDVYRLNSSFSVNILFKVYIPLMSGFLRQAFNNAVGMGIKIIVTTEYLVQTKGSLGKAIFTSGYFNEYAEIYAYALIMILLVLLLSVLPQVVLKKASRVVFKNANRENFSREN